MNLLEIFSDVVTIYGDVEVDEQQLAAGQSVAIPSQIQVGSVGGKPIYLVGSLTTTKPAAPQL